MAIRRWAVYPPPGQQVVDREDLVAAIMDAEAIQWRAGGVVTIMHERRPTELEHEMVTVVVVIEWKDRTDARAQAEPAAPSRPLEAPAPPEAEVAEPEVLVGAGGVHDGLDPSTLLDEDLASVPASLR